eukprot:6152631-Pleurochrysis_carterae.AAC.6
MHDVLSSGKFISGSSHGRQLRLCSQAGMTSTDTREEVKLHFTCSMRAFNDLLVGSRKWNPSYRANAGQTRCLPRDDSFCTPTSRDFYSGSKKYASLERSVRLGPSGSIE